MNKKMWMKSVKRDHDSVIASVDRETEPNPYSLMLIGSYGGNFVTVCSKRFKRRWWKKEGFASVYNRAESWLKDQVSIIEEREKVDIRWPWELEKKPNEVAIDIVRGSKKSRSKKNG